METSIKGFIGNTKLAKYVSEHAYKNNLHGEEYYKFSIKTNGTWRTVHALNGNISTALNLKSGDYVQITNPVYRNYKGSTYIVSNASLVIDPSFITVIKTAQQRRLYV